jgi:hypothetical protein
MSSTLLLGCVRVSICIIGIHAGTLSYLLVDEIFVIVLDIQLALHLLDLSTLHE